jgi:apolipoprotein N-acyltransferase
MAPGSGCRCCGSTPVHEPTGPAIMPISHCHQPEARATEVNHPLLALRAGRNAALACHVAAVASGLLLWLSYSPASAGWLAWVALVPWLMLVRAGVATWRRYILAWLSGLLFFVPALQWMRVAHPTMFYSWLCLAWYCSWYFLLALWLLRRLDRRTGWPLTLTVPLVWTALEFLRSNFAGGFAWYLLGHSQHDFLPVVQIADLAGVAGVTFLVAAVNGLIAEVLYRRPSIVGIFAVRERDAAFVPASLRGQWLGAGVSLVAVLAYGAWQIGRGSFAEGPRVALLQTNIPQGIRNDRLVDGDRGAAAADSLTDITKRLVARAIRDRRPDLVIWPETTFPNDWQELSPEAPPSPKRTAFKADVVGIQADFRAFAADIGTNALAGLNTLVYGADGVVRRYNSALHLTPAQGVVARYDKMHLVPFGEYVPFRDTIPLLARLAPYDYDYSLVPGEKQTRFRMTTHDGRSFAFGALICYEDSDAPLARTYARSSDGPPVDFLVNLSNDGWFMGTSEHEEHLAVSRFRAIETRRSLVRAVNMGISAVIDGNGRIVALPDETWRNSKGIESVVTAMVPIDTRMSVYAHAGDWLPWGCWVAVAYGCFRRRKESRDVRR